MDKIKSHKIYLLAFLIPLAFWLLAAVKMQYAPFGENSLLMHDAIHQYYPFFGQYRDRILAGEGIFYSAGGGLGFNFYALWTYYLSSPLNLLILLFPVSQLDSAMDLLIIVKIALSGTAFAYYLGQKCGACKASVLPFSCGYALSSFMIGYCYNIMWLDCLALFPVILAGQEKLMKEGKWRLYTVSLALSLWCSFYISFIICLFLILWFLLNEHPSVKDFLKKGILFSLASFLSAGIACVVLLPAYLGIVEVQSGTVFPDFDWMGRFSEIFAGKEGGIFAFSDPLSLNNEVAYNANLYCGVFVVILAVLYFFAKDIKMIQKAGMAWLIVLFVLSFNNQGLNYIWHGFHYQVGIPNRFAFLLIFLLLLLAFEAFVRLHSFCTWQILCSGAAALVLYLTLYFLQRENVTVRMLVSTLACVVVYTAFWAFFRKEMISAAYVSRLLVAFMCLELCVSAYMSCKVQAGVSAGAFYRNQADLQKMAEQLPYDQYRTELSNPTVKNEGLAYNLRGTGIFSSLANLSTVSLLHDIGFPSSSNSYIPGGSTPVINTLFGIKNYLILSPDVNALDYRYEESACEGGVTAYENEQILPAAFLCEETVKDWSSLNSDFFINQMRLIEQMTGKKYKIFTEQEYELADSNDIQVESLDEHQQYSYLSAVGTRNDHIVFEAVADRDEDLYLRIQAQYSNKIAVLVNDEAIAYKDLSSSFYHVGNVEKGDKITVMVGIQEDSPTYGMVSMSMYAYHQDVMDEVYEELSPGGMDVTQWREGYIKGRVQVTDTKQTLFTTIPYDKGWSIYVDGVKQRVQTIHGGLLAVPLKEGSHEVVFSYTVPGLKTGACVTLVSLMIFTGAAAAGARKKKKASRAQ